MSCLYDLEKLRAIWYNPGQREFSVVKKHAVSDINGNNWIYSDEVEDHFFRPRNVMFDDIDEKNYNAVSEIGSPACGDLMRIWLKIENDKIVDFKWKTYGCASAIAAASMLS